MTLGERIAYYRKRAGYSQEELAERLEVSRQAISKWETGEATPDAERIIALAAALDISTDTLLLGKEDPSPTYTAAETVQQPAPTPEWLNHLPRHIGRLFREKGYIAGYIVAAQGLGILLVGLLARFGFGSMLSIENNAWGMLGSWGSMSGMGNMSAAFRFPLIFADVICGLGGIFIIGGIALAIIWKKRGQQ